jgi:hypothetical protein
MKFYCYRHIRPDKNEPFYIGIGQKTTDSPKSITDEYRRAYMTNNRSSIWNGIYERNNKKIEVEILFESHDHEEIKQKEKEFVALYGRINLGTGFLANLTDGGDFTFGWVPSEETKRKISEAHTGKKYAEGRRSANFGKTGPLNHKWGVPNSPETRRKLSLATKGKNVGSTNPSARAVVQFDLQGNQLRNFSTMKEAAFFLHPEKEDVNVSPSIIKAYKGKQKTAYGYKWKYKKDWNDS